MKPSPGNDCPDSFSIVVEQSSDCITELNPYQLFGVWGLGVGEGRGRAEVLSGAAGKGGGQTPFSAPTRVGQE